MSQILVRNMKPEVVKLLKRRAARDGRSLEAEARAILEQAARTPKLDRRAALALADAFRRRFKGRKFSDSAALVRQERDR